MLPNHQRARGALAPPICVAVALKMLDSFLILTDGPHHNNPFTGQRKAEF